MEGVGLEGTSTPPILLDKFQHAGDSSGKSCSLHASCIPTGSMDLAGNSSLVLVKHGPQHLVHQGPHFRFQSLSNSLYCLCQYRTHASPISLVIEAPLCWQFPVPHESMLMWFPIALFYDSKEPNPPSNCAGVRLIQVPKGFGGGCKGAWHAGAGSHPLSPGVRTEGEIMQPV